MMSLLAIAQQHTINILFTTVPSWVCVLNSVLQYGPCAAQLSCTLASCCEKEPTSAIAGKTAARVQAFIWQNHTHTHSLRSIGRRLPLPSIRTSPLDDRS